MKNKNPDHLERNVESLLAGTEPMMAIPESVSAAILARLVEPAAELDQQKGETVEPPLPEITCIATPTAEPRPQSRARAQRFRLPSRRTKWLAAAAAVALVVLAGLWYGGSLSDPGIAGVAGSSEKVRTLEGHMLVIQNGEAVSRSRFYWRDPGLARIELLQADDRVGQIIVIRREPGLARQLSLCPEEQRAELATHRLRGLADLPLHLVAELWQKSAHIIGTAEYRLGEEERNGIPTITHEAPGDMLLPPGKPPFDPGRVKVWVRQDTGRPLAYQIKFQQKADTFNDFSASQLEWDVPLDDSLFDLEVPEGWQLKQVRYEVIEPAAARLASNVTLGIGPESGQALVRESDVAAVTKIECFEELDRGVPASISLTLELLPEAAARLASHTAEFPQELLLADFNGEIRAVPKLEMPSITLDLSRLNASLGECERRYLRIDDEVGQAVKSDTIEPVSSPSVLFELRSVSDEAVTGWSKRTHLGRTVYLSPQVAITNADVARAWIEPTGKGRGIGLAMTGQGAIKLARYTQERIGEKAAILLDGEIVTAPVVRGVFSERAAIDGDFSEEEARVLVAGITGRRDPFPDAAAIRRANGRSQRTMNDMQSIGLALASYAQDIGGYPSGGLGEIARRIEPFYIRETPLRDAWGNPFAVQSSPTSYSISSWGSDGQPGEPGQGATSNLKDDIIFSNGAFVQWHSTEE